MVLPVAGDSQGWPSRPARGCPARECLACAATPSLATRADRTVAEGCAGRRSVQGRGRVNASARSTPCGVAAPFPRGRSRRRAFRGRTSERGGRSSWRRSGTATTTPIVGVSRRRPLLVPPRSHDLYPVVQVTNPHRWCPRVPARRPHPRRWSPPGSPSRRGWARRVLGRHGVGRSGACAAPPALPGSRGCRRRSTSARWRPSRSAPPCPGPGCRSG